MSQKYFAIAAIVFIAWFSWFFRYEPMPKSEGSSSVMLDRWTGNILVAERDDVAWVDVQSFETKSMK